MAGDKILVFGATGPAGIVLPRELLHRKLPALAYCRSPSKIPNDLASHPLLEGPTPQKMAPNIFNFYHSVRACNRLQGVLPRQDEGLEKYTLLNCTIYDKAPIELIPRHSPDSHSSCLFHLAVNFILTSAIYKPRNRLASVNSRPFCCKTQVP
ncbi:hypothetical protein ACKLNR_012961 [Fusarium oxysporum f. sp. zingiberi]